MGSAPSDPHRPFKQRLEAFEEALAIPAVSGELETWLSNVAKQARLLCDHLQQRRKQLYEDVYGDITDEDPELSNQVEQLRNEDDAITGELLRVEEWANKALQSKPVEPAEDVRESLNEVVDNGLQLTARLRKHEIALREWLSEAVYRDRGPVD